MHLILSCVVHHSQIIQRILDNLRMVTNMCYLITLALMYLSFMVLIV
jgi:hypothetical protein